MPGQDNIIFTTHYIVKGWVYVANKAELMFIRIGSSVKILYKNLGYSESGLQVCVPNIY